jgi:sugar O-acyltransferase (sialic acid O-acetyltransferase NeuD family)
MSTDPLMIMGAGGHAKVVADAVLAAAPDAAPVVADANAELAGRVLLGSLVVQPAAQAMQVSTQFHVAIGSNTVREDITQRCIEAGMRARSVIHPSASVSPFATVAAGSFVAAHAVVGPAAVVGQGCIINHGAVVDHDCVVGDFSHIAPNATLGGGVQIGKRVLIGAGATILPKVLVGDDCIVGAGAVARGNLRSGGVYVGVPAMCINGELE